MHRIARLALVVALGGCGTRAPGLLPASFQPEGVAKTSRASEQVGDLYVSVSKATHYPSIERFPVVNGLPAKNPDEVYEGYGGPIAASADGTLYVADAGAGKDFTIFAFSPQSSKPSRKFEVPMPGRCGAYSGAATIPAITADAQGNLFAAIYTYPQARTHQGQRDASRRSALVPCSGVAVFAPDATGKAKPIQTITLPRGSDIVSLAVDAKDNLYVADFPSKVIEFANAVAGPSSTRIFHAKSEARFSSLATDAYDNVFISNTYYGYKTAFINRYSPSAKANRPPTSQILLQGSGLHYLISVAVLRGVLYAADGFESIDLYHARKNGGQIPFYSLAASDIASIAAGP
jgi:hypothetical protein